MTNDDAWRKQRRPRFKLISNLSITLVNICFNLSYSIMFDFFALT